MKILGNRVLVSKIEEPAKEGFTTVEVQDSFIYKGKVEQVGLGVKLVWRDGVVVPPFVVDDIVLFAKYSPDTQEIEHEGKKMKLVKVDDILAIL